MFARRYAARWQVFLRKPYVQILFGARQTGKSTLIRGLLPDGALVEAKWTENPSLSDARHLLTFMAEHPQKAREAFIICRCPRPMRLHERVVALPWFCL